MKQAVFASIIVFLILGILPLTALAETPATPSVKVLSPNGGETVHVGENLTIKWEGSGESVSISYLSCPENTTTPTCPPGEQCPAVMNIAPCMVGEIASSISNTKSYDWKVTIPEIANSFSNQFKIQITAYGGSASVTDISDNYFTILPAGPTTCVDSDGEMNYDVKGTTALGNVSYTDYCNGSGTYFENGKIYNECSGKDCYLNEHYCASPTQIGQKSDIVCPYGCSSGACKPKPIDGTTTEHYTCLFHNSNGYDTDYKIGHTCYGSNDKTGESVNCTATMQCGNDITGPEGSTVTWKSSCDNDKNPITQMDGKDETINFDCSGIEPPKVECTDSDGGANYFVQGTTQGKYNFSGTVAPEYQKVDDNARLTDYCIQKADGKFAVAVGGHDSYLNSKVETCKGDCALSEFVCSNDGWVVQDVFNCPGGCLNGACVGQTSNTLLIYEYGDYEDPYTVRFYNETLPLIKKEYGSRVGIEFEHFPLAFHKNAQKAAEAAECSKKLGRAFDQYSNLLLENSPQLDVDSLKKYAAQIELDKENFAYCLDNGKMAQEVQDDYERGVAKGVTGTPSFFIGHQLLIGAQPYENFKSAIDEALSGGTSWVNEEVTCIFDSTETIEHPGNFPIPTNPQIPVEKITQTVRAVSPSIEEDKSVGQSVEEDPNHIRHECYTSNISFETVSNTACSGYDSCTASVKGQSQTKVEWKSSCGGYATTILDGQNEKIVFHCKDTLPGIEFVTLMLGQSAKTKSGVMITFKAYLETTTPQEPAQGSTGGSESPSYVGTTAPSVNPTARVITRSSEQLLPTTTTDERKIPYTAAIAIVVNEGEGDESLTLSLRGGVAYTKLGTAIKVTNAEPDGALTFAIKKCTSNEPCPTGPITLPPTPTGQCSEGDTHPFECSNGAKVSWCSCLGSEWKCVDSPQIACSGNSADLEKIQQQLDEQRKLLEEQKGILEKILDWLQNLFGFKPA